MKNEINFLILQHNFFNVKVKIMKKFIGFLFLFLAFNVNFLFSQNVDNEILMAIGKRKITRGEFLRIFEKNYQMKANSTQDRQKALQEYLQLFINFKIKVVEAESMGLDTTTAFKNELENYRKQLAKPYLTDKNIIEDLAKEAYQRIQTEVKVSHILVNVGIDASPQDTILAYQKAMKIRQRLLNNEDFGKVAVETSDDPAAQRTKGDIGYIVVFKTPYEFESHCYSAKVNEISLPVRTFLGYHIVKVTEKRPSQGKIRVAHIMISSPQNSAPSEMEKAKQKIFDIAKQLKNGANFEALAEQHSDDKGTGNDGGKLNWFGTGEMVAEFENAAFALQKDGDISEPVQTAYGWHIIKRLEKKVNPPYEKVEAEMKSLAATGDRAEMGKYRIIEKIKKENQFKQLSNLSAFYNVLDSTVFHGTWDVKKAASLTQPLFSFGNKTYSQQDFANYIATRQAENRKIPVENYVARMYKYFVSEIALQYEEVILETKYPEFKSTLEEYHDGILLFDLMDKMIWSESIRDTAGMKQFFEKQKNNPSYLWKERIEASVFQFENNDALSAAQKLLKKREKKNLSNEDIVKEVNKEKPNSLKFLTSGTYEKATNDTLDVVFKKRESKEIDEKEQFVVQNDKKILIFITKFIPSERKTFYEVRGILTADYQNYLEEQWLKKLKEKHSVQVNQEVFSKIK